MLTPFLLPSSHPHHSLPQMVTRRQGREYHLTWRQLSHTPHIQAASNTDPMSLTFPEGRIGSVKFPLIAILGHYFFLKKKRVAKDVDCLKQPIHVLGTPSSLQDQTIKIPQIHQRFVPEALSYSLENYFTSIQAVKLSDISH